MIFKLLFLVNGILSFALATTRFPSEYYLHKIKRDKCDFDLETINHKCNLGFLRIDYKVSVLYTKAETFCKVSFENLDKLCKNVKSDFCVNEYQVREDSCRKRLQHAKKFEKWMYKKLDIDCNKDYVAHNLLCQSVNKPWKASRKEIHQHALKATRRAPKGLQQMTTNSQRKNQKGEQVAFEKREDFKKNMLGSSEGLSSRVRRSSEGERNFTTQITGGGSQNETVSYIILDGESVLRDFNKTLLMAENLAKEIADKARRWSSEIQAMWAPQEDEDDSGDKPDVPITGNSIAKEIQKRRASKKRLLEVYVGLSSSVNRSQQARWNITNSTDTASLQRAALKIVQLIFDSEAELLAFNQALTAAEKQAKEIAEKARKWAATVVAMWESENNIDNEMVDPEEKPKVKTSRKRSFTTSDPSFKEDSWKKSIEKVLFNVEEYLKEKKETRNTDIKKTYGKNDWKKSVRNLLDRVAKSIRKNSLRKKRNLT